MDCIFCRIIAGEIPAHRIAEDAATLAFLDIHPLSQGHTLVIPRRHCANLFEAQPDDLAAVAQMTKQVGQQLKAALSPDGLNVMQNNGPAAGQDVFHYHVHLIPRWSNDGLLRGWQRQPTEGVNLAELAARIRTAY